MKKIILIPAAAGVLAFGGIVLANTDQTNGTDPAAAEMNTAPEPAQKSEEMIGFEKASAIALAIADGKVTQIELGEDDGRQEYEVEIRDAEFEYDFDIDAFSGEVTEQVRERLNDDDRNSVNQETAKADAKKSNQAADNAKGIISADKAKEIALKESGGGKIVDFELDSDDGFQYYEVEVVNGNTEFEMEINAADGSLMEFEQDDEDDDDR